jgi:hypothetical protein
MEAPVLEEPTVEQPTPSVDFWQNVQAQAAETSDTAVSPTEPNSTFESEMRAEAASFEPEALVQTDAETAETTEAEDDSEGKNKPETDAPPVNPWHSNPWQGDL